MRLIQPKIVTQIEYKDTQFGYSHFCCTLHVTMQTRLYLMLCIASLRIVVTDLQSTSSEFTGFIVSFLGIVLYRSSTDLVGFIETIEF
jgi:hypothetical protein